MTFSVASLFTGLGGFDIASEQLGLDVVLQAETDPAARRILQKRFPRVHLEGDARLVDVRGVDLVTAGFPCQGMSRAAATRKHAGLMDERSKSFVIWEVLKRVSEARVPFLLLENSNSLQTKEFAADMKKLLEVISSLGYHAHVLTLNSGCYGSAMRRKRTFVLGRLRPWLLPDQSGRISYKCSAEGIGVNNQQGGAVFCAQPSVTLKSRSYNLMITRDEVWSLQPEAIEVLFGLEPGWTEAAGSASARYERLGNAVSVDAARAALQLLLFGDAEMSQPTYDYGNLKNLSELAGGGAAGSALGRILRDIRSSRGGVNRIEWSHCLPVYMNWVEQHPDDLDPRMWDYLKELKSLTRKYQPERWPNSATVTMEQ